MHTLRITLIFHANEKLKCYTAKGAKIAYARREGSTTLGLGCVPTKIS